MSKLKQLSFCLGLAMIMSFQAQAQKTQKEIKGDKYFSCFLYSKAISKYENTKELTMDGLRNLAKSYENNGQLIEAEGVYSRIVASQGRTAEDCYNYASVLRKEGKYENSNIWMNKFKELSPNDLRAKNYLFEKSTTDKLLQDKGNYRIVNLNINSEEEDFGPAFYNDKIIFATSRERTKTVKRIYNRNQKSFLDVYVAEIDSEQLNSVRVLDKQLNKKWHEGPASYSHANKLLAFTQNNYNGKSKSGEINLQIYFKEIQNNEWQKEEPFKLNNSEYSVGHPCISDDAGTMYFASDMPGGYGGVDLYVIKKDVSGEWGQAINLGPKINTEGDEMFPFCEETTGTFFFASNGHQGLGGLDLFVSKVKLDTIFGKVINMAAPMNTRFDDFALIIHDNLKNGYFSSNREGGKGDDDIYYFEMLQPIKFQKIIQGIVRDDMGMVLSNASVKLMSDTGDQKDIVSTNKNGEYYFEVDDEDKYKLIAAKEAYSESQKVVSTLNIQDTVYSDFILYKIPSLSFAVKVIDKQSRVILSNARVKLQDNILDESTNYVTSDSGQIVKDLVDNRLNDRISYNVTVDKTGYLSKVITYNQLLDKDTQYVLTVVLDKIGVGLDLASLIDIRPIYFDLGKYTIRKDAAVELDKIVQVMNENPNMLIELGSHTDCRGAYSSNESLSNKRAISSADYIKKRISNPERIYGRGYGESRLKNGCACEGEIKSSCSEEEHQQNRRTEFIIIKMDE